MWVRNYGKKSIKHLSTFKYTKYAFHFSSPPMPGNLSNKLSIEHKFGEANTGMVDKATRHMWFYPNTCA